MYIRDAGEVDWSVFYMDTLIYTHQNQISEYQLSIGNSAIYKELYFYNTAGDKIRYEEYRKSMISNEYTPSHKEFYYYNPESLSPTSEFVQMESIKVFPNPASAYITIESTSGSRRLNYRIINLNGELLDGGRMETNTKQVDLSSFPPAIYYLQIIEDEAPGFVQATKIVKQ